LTHNPSESAKLLPLQGDKALSRLASAGLWQGGALLLLKHAAAGASIAAASKHADRGCCCTGIHQDLKHVVLLPMGLHCKHVGGIVQV
jgi:hypothetical protein